jgi:hypothetical protein
MQRIISEVPEPEPINPQTRNEKALCVLGRQGEAQVSRLNILGVARDNPIVDWASVTWFVPYLTVAILDVANGDISTLLDSSFKRPLFSLYPVEFFLPEVVGDCFLVVNNMLAIFLSESRVFFIRSVL